MASDTLGDSAGRDGGLGVSLNNLPARYGAGEQQCYGLSGE